jgi:imidazolonepropionase-like amidohydrolase
MPKQMIRRCAGLFAAFVAACALEALAFAPASRAEGGEPRYFAIEGARIVPVSGPVIESGTVVVADGLIKAVGTNVPIPPEAWVINGKGLTVYPGLNDAMTDVGLVAAPTGGPGGGVGGRPAPQKLSMGPEDRPGTTPWVIAADEIKPDDKRIESWRNAGFTTALVAPRGGVFPGQGSVINLAGERAGDMVVKSPATLDLDFKPIGGFFSFPGSLMGVIAYVRQVFIDARWYTDAEQVYKGHTRGLERPAYDRTERVVSHALRGKELVLVPANNEIQILRGLRLIDEWKIPAALYGGQQSYAVADAIAAKKIPVLVSLKWPEREKDADPEAEQDLRTLQFRDRAPSSPAALQKAGVKFAFYSEGITSPKDILKNAKKAIDAGLAEYAALRALTLSAAEIFGVDDRLGSIEPGKIANLVLADGDLFSEKTKIKYVFVDGRRFEVRETERPKEPPKGNLTGKWTLTYTTPEGPEEGTLDVTMAPDGTLTGTFSGKRGTQSLSNGWVSGDSFHFTVSITHEEGPQDVNFSGTFEKDTMKGTISVQGFSIDFTGTRPGGRQSAAAGN